MTENSKRKLEFIINVVFISFILVLVYLFFKHVFSILLPFIISFLIVLLVNSISKRIFKKLKIRKRTVSIICMILLYILIGNIIFFTIFALFKISANILYTLPEYYQTTISPILINILSKIEELILMLPETLEFDWNIIKTTLISSLQSLVIAISQKGLSSITNLTSNIPGILVTTIFTIAFSFFFIIQYDKIIPQIKKVMPNKLRLLASDMKDIMKNTILKYIKAYIKIMFITFIELLIGLIILQIPNALTIATCTAIFDALPFFGTGAILIPWGIISLISSDIFTGLGLLILYAVITVVRNFIEPKIIGDQLGINPVISISAIYLGYRTCGFLGMIFFPMITEILTTLYKSGYFKKVVT